MIRVAEHPRNEAITRPQECSWEYGKHDLAANTEHLHRSYADDRLSLILTWPKICLESKSKPPCWYHGRTGRLLKVACFVISTTLPRMPSRLSDLAFSCEGVGGYPMVIRWQVCELALQMRRK